MKNTLTSITALLLSAAILIAGHGLQGALLPVRANMENFPAYAIGLMGAAYYLGFTLGSIKGVNLIREVGHIRVFAAMTAIASATPLLHSLFLNEIVWGVLRLISGFCAAALYVVIESWLNERSTNETRGTVFSLYIVIQMTVVAIGQQMLLLADPREMPLFAVVSLLISLAAVPVALSTSAIPREVPTFTFDLKRLYRISPEAIFGCMTIGLASSIFYTLSPLFTASISDDISVTAGFMTAGVLGGAVGQWPLGMISDRLDRRLVLAFSAISCAVVSGLLWFLSSSISYYGVLALGALWGAFAFPLYALSVAHANDYAEDDEFVMISSGMLLVYGLGAILGPFLGSLLINLFGAGGMFLLVCATCVWLTLYIIYRFVREKAPDEDKHFPYSEALAAATTKSQIYEYSEEQEHSLETPTPPDRP